MGIKFDKDYLAVKQNNYLTKIVTIKLLPLSIMYMLGQEILLKISILKIAYLGQLL